MTNKEAIERLEACQENRNSCEVCKFEHDCGIYDVEEAAIKALEKQIPKKVRVFCSNCGAELSFLSLISCETQWCGKCGSAIDWG